MTRRILTLMGKDLVQNAIVLVAFLLLMVLTFALLLLGTAVSPERITLLSAHAAFVHVFAPLTGLFLGHRLVVQEYSARTQLFVEALPIRPFEHLLAKVLLGLLILWGACLASLFVASAAAALREALSLRWVGLVALRTLGFTFALWSFFLAMGLLGRWRIPIYVGLFFFIVVLTETSEVELSRFGPLALVGETFVLERERLPAADLGVTVSFGALFLLFAFGLASVREGSIAESLARKMTQREKVAAGVLLLAGTTISATLSERRAKPPFEFAQEQAVHHAAAPVHLLYLDEAYRARAEALADAIADDLQSLGDALGWRELPPIHLALRTSLDHRTFEATPLVESDGVLLHANFVAHEVDEQALRARVLAHAIESATAGRAAFEPFAWVRTALAEVWVRRGEEAPSLPAMRRALWLSEQRSPRYEMLRYWYRTSERYGETVAAAFAYSAGRSLVEEVGLDRFLDLARELFAGPAPRDSRPVIGLRLRSVAERLEAATGLDRDRFEVRWKAFLESARRDPRYRLGALGSASSPHRIQPVVHLDALRAESGLSELRYRIASPATREPIASTCTLLHAALGPFDAPLDPRDLVREQRPCEELHGEGARISGRYGPGERVLIALDVIDPELDSAVRLGAERLEVP